MPTEEYHKRKLRYIRQYNKNNYCSVTISFKKGDPAEMRIREHLRLQPSTAKYLKDLVKADMENTKKDGD